MIQTQSQRQWQGLLDAGLEIHCYQPTVFHPKVLTVDEQLVMVGTANFDLRSFTFNQQVNLIIDDPACTAVLDGHVDDDLAESHPVVASRWRDRNRRRRDAEVADDLAMCPLIGFGGAGLTPQHRP